MKSTQELIVEECDELKELLLKKNESYGDSAANPIGVFAQDVDPITQINIRIDDKLNRIKRGQEYPGDDTEIDLIGYLILKRVVTKQRAGKDKPTQQKVIEKPKKTNRPKKDNGTPEVSQTVEIIRLMRKRSAVFTIDDIRQRYEHFNSDKMDRDAFQYAIEKLIKEKTLIVVERVGRPGPGQKSAANIYRYVDNDSSPLGVE